MDIEILPIATVEAEGRAAAIARACPHHVNRYQFDSRYWWFWTGEFLRTRAELGLPVCAIGAAAQCGGLPACVCTLDRGEA